jgi:integrase/recombinase XerD
MRISLKLLLYKSKTYADGSHPVLLQYIINCKVKRKVLTRCKPDDWDLKTQRVKAKVKNSASINNIIATAFGAAEKQIYDVQVGDKPVRSLFEGPAAETFSAAIQKELERLKVEMKAGAYNKLIGYTAQIREYCDVDLLSLKDMDIAWFKGYAKYLAGLGNIGSTSQKKVKTIRAVVLRYLGKEKVSEELRCYRIPARKTIKQKLDTGEFARLESLELPEGDIVLAVRDLFLLQVYLRGIRVGDLLQAGPDQFDEGFFKYKDDKTGQNFSIKIIPRAQVIIDKYLSTDARLFPFFKWQYNPKLNDFDNKVKRLKEKESCTSVINKYLKIIATMADINKPLSSHIARHTFARMAIDRINNPMVTMELMGHSSLVVHQQYLNDLRKDEELDRAADDIFS